jgi:hypothetical protein
MVIVSVGIFKVWINGNSVHLHKAFLSLIGCWHHPEFFSTPLSALSPARSSIDGLFGTARQQIYDICINNKYASFV